MSSVLGIRDIYKFYKKNNSDSVLLLEFLDIVNGYSNYLMTKLIDAEAVPLPERLGLLEFSGLKLKPRIDNEGRIQGLSPDWKKTNELWNKCDTCKEEKQLVFFFNEHTQGLRYKLRWSKKRVFVSNKEYYAFRLSFTNKKRFKDALMEGKEYYVKTFN